MTRFGTYDNLPYIAQACGQARKTRRGFICLCPAHDDHNPSLEIWPGEVAVLVHCYAGCHPSNVLRALRAKGFQLGARWRPSPTRQRVAQSAAWSAFDAHFKSSKDLKDSTAVVSNKTRILQRLAGNIWREAVDPFGTPVESYLAGRGLNLRHVDAGVLRFHPACPRGKLRQPAMVALVRNYSTDQPQAVHRTFLSPDHRKDGQAMVLGPAGGAAINLCQDVASGNGAAEGRVKLHTCEGIETGIGLLMLGYAPLWSLVTAGGLARLPILPGVDELIACSDHDANRVGQRAAYTAVRRWRAAGKAAREIRPYRCEWDFADVAKLLTAGAAP